MRISIICVTIVAAVTPCARSDVLEFINNYDGFVQALNDVDTIDFETLPDGSPSDASVQITPTFNYDLYGAHFTANEVIPYLSGNSLSGYGLRTTVPFPNRTWLRADMTEPARGVGITFGGGQELRAYDMNDLLIWSVNYFQGGGGHFLGIVSTTPISYIIADKYGSIASMDAFHFSTIPEPAGIILLSVGLARLARGRGRK